MQHSNASRKARRQTAGPYVHIGCVPNFCGIGGVYPGRPRRRDGRRQVRAGERITVGGTVIDGTGTPLRDALVEIWQADADGLYRRRPARPGRPELHRLGPAGRRL